MFDGIGDYVLWKRKMNTLLVQQDMHSAIDANDLFKKSH